MSLYGNKKKPVVVFVEFTFFIDAGAHVRVYTHDVWWGASYKIGVISTKRTNGRREIIVGTLSV